MFPVVSVVVRCVRCDQSAGHGGHNEPRRTQRQTGIVLIRYSFISICWKKKNASSLCPLWFAVSAVLRYFQIDQASDKLEIPL